MAVTTEHLQVPESTEPVPARPSKSSRRVVVGWAATAAGLVAAAALAVAVLVPDQAPSKVDTGRVIAERGSIAAIDHRDAQVAARVAAAQGSDRHLEILAAEIAQAHSSERP